MSNELENSERRMKTKLKEVLGVGITVTTLFAMHEGGHIIAAWLVGSTELFHREGNLFLVMSWNGSHAPIPEIFVVLSPMILEFVYLKQLEKSKLWIIYILFAHRIDIMASIIAISNLLK